MVQIYDILVTISYHSYLSHQHALHQHRSSLPAFLLLLEWIHRSPLQDVLKGVLERREDDGHGGNDHYELKQFHLNIQFKSPSYKTIRRIRAFNEETLIGNLGGYVGLFLGIAVWQFPDFIEFLAMKIKSCCKRTKL